MMTEGVTGWYYRFESCPDYKNIIMIDLDKAKFIGEGEWVKDSAYQVYELDGKYYSVIVIGHSNKEIMDDSITEIAEEDISKYI